MHNKETQKVFVKLLAISCFLLGFLLIQQATLATPKSQTNFGQSDGALENRNRKDVTLENRLLKRDSQERTPNGVNTEVAPSVIVNTQNLPAPNAQSLGRAPNNFGTNAKGVGGVPIAAGSGPFDCFSMIRMQDTCAGSIERRYAMGHGYEQMLDQLSQPVPMDMPVTSEVYGADNHEGERRSVVPPVILPPGQKNVQQEAVGTEPGYRTKQAAAFARNAVARSPVAYKNATDTSDIVIRAIARNIKLQQSHSPARSYQPAQIAQQAKIQGAADATGDAAQHVFAAAFDCMFQNLINVANDSAGSPGPSEALSKSLPNAIWIIMQMYKNVFVYMGVLLLLPGAILTQTKAMVGYGLLNQPEDGEVQAVSPFVGIMRAVIAIFLIPSTQLILSWCVDVGNSCQYEVTQFVNMQTVFQWATEQLYCVPPQNAVNQQLPVSSEQDYSAWGGNSGTVRGKLSNGSASKSQVETCSDATRIVQLMFNLINIGLGAALIASCAIQMGMICYLFCLGPIAAAFFAWPSGVGSLFSKVFGNWVDAVINVSLWRFWWMVILLCMYTRIQWLQDMGAYDPTCQWEMIIFTAFAIILVYVPLMPFDFRPGEMVDKVDSAVERARELSAPMAAEASGGAQKASHKPHK